MGAPHRIVEQASRRIEDMSWGKAWNWTVIDTYGQFLAPRGVAALVNVDGFHPNAEGSKVWAAEVQRVLGV